ncbi:unnamed protein product [Pleuronectes platessa]|uniref:Uncharacterized protein n=1 Tax=Pleuronectes platessa TaxID=8262 RepID=A0A9N7VG43_PLEPL|nr:unnamed protein product [Pleuronectes platessa]
MQVPMTALLGNPQQQQSPPPPNSPLAAPCSPRLWQLSVAACQRLCDGQTRHWRLKLSGDVDWDKGWGGGGGLGLGTAAVRVLVAFLLIIYESRVELEPIPADMGGGRGRSSFLLQSKDMHLN